ncbi:hypothetical protein G6Z92_06130 [Vibrio aestuarianus subsp. cardii]|uniref:hypothetical protein n=1 Tax=Vibrio aestuarianus TaxID=28171 RepID=UPI0015C54C4F|nr:hypothetical protein [Vibrio aestuarianus]NGZ66563.1 hypothetical protein [Vibrio aestuarianus subsp. cardii]
MKITLFHTKETVPNKHWAWRHIRGSKVTTELMAKCTDGRSRRVYVENNLQRAHAYVVIKNVKHYIASQVFGFDNLKGFEPKHAIHVQSGVVV